MVEFIHITKGVFTGLGEMLSFKLLPSIAIALFGVLFGLDNYTVIRALLFLISIDFITGIASAKATKEVIKSKTAVRSAFKVAVYGLLLSAGHLTETVTPGSTYIEEAVATFLAITELISIIENIGKMGFAVPKRLLNQLHKFRDEETVTTETATTHTIHDTENNIVETHKVVEKVEEKHTVEKPNQPQG